MAKKVDEVAKKAKLVESSRNREEVDDLLDNVFKRAEMEFGSKLYTGEEAESMAVGLPLPFPMAYCLQSSVWPLGRFAMLYGPQGSGKSALLYEIMKWHREYGGRNVLLETEHKDSPALRNAILNNDYKAVVCKHCKSLESWMEQLNYYVRSVQETLTGTKRQPGPGRTVPMCFGVDSLTAVLAEDSIKKIESEGAPGRRHPLEAKLMTDQMRFIPSRIEEWPFSFVGVNHQKPSQEVGPNPFIKPQPEIPGGKGLRFQATTELAVRFGGDIRGVDYEGIRVYIKAEKVSGAPSRKSIEAELIWWTEFDDEGKPSYKAMWNWPAATINLLLKFRDDKIYKALWKNIYDIVDLNQDGKIHVWSTVLGIPQSEPANFFKAGVKLMARKDLLESIGNRIGIRSRPTFKPGLDYREQIGAAAAKIIGNFEDDELPDELSSQEFREIIE